MRHGMSETPHSVDLSNLSISTAALLLLQFADGVC